MMNPQFFGAAGMRTWGLCRKMQRSLTTGLQQEWKLLSDTSICPAKMSGFRSLCALRCTIQLRLQNRQRNRRRLINRRKRWQITTIAAAGAAMITRRPNRKNSDGFRYSDDRKPRFDGDRKPRFDGDRKPRFDSDRKARFDSDRKPFESDFFEDEVLDVEFNAFPSPEIVENDEQERDLPSIIMGRNPVKEAIKSGRSIDRILVTKEHDGSLGEIIGLARDENLVIREVDRSKLDEICMPFGHNGKPGNHQASLQKSRVLNMPNSRIYLTMPAFAMKNPLLFFLTALKIRIISAQSSAVRSAPAHTELL